MICAGLVLPGAAFAGTAPDRQDPTVSELFNVLLHPKGPGLPASRDAAPAKDEAAALQDGAPVPPAAAVAPAAEKPAPVQAQVDVPVARPRHLAVKAVPRRRPGHRADGTDKAVNVTGSDPARLPANLLLGKPSLIDRVLVTLKPARQISPEDAARYANIFAFQDTGEFLKANAEIEKLTDGRLLGHVLAQRYMSKSYRTGYDELAAWMTAYADLPEAQKIYELAKKRQPRKAAALQKPRTGRGVYALYDFDVGQVATPAADLALQEAAAQGEKNSPYKAWNEGLKDWRAGNYAAAAASFEQTANARRASAWLASAGAHWAARCYLRSRQPEKVGYWLRRAAEYPRTFYGIISAKALGMEEAKFNWEVPELTAHYIRALSAVPAGARALALVQAERPDLAETELGQMNPGSDTTLQEAMIALAAQSGMPGLAMRMGSSFKTKDGRLYDAALYPDGPWEPARGFSVDRALVFAFVRQESRFHTDASNKSSGATGLMQLMPETARHVARLAGDHIEHEHLQDPNLNIDLGQQYLAELLRNDSVSNNLFRLAVAYNAGPGKLSRWSQQVDYRNDPLLFIESIPAAETRIFVERVLANYWIYRLKYGQETVSLDRVAEGSWPAYVAQDGQRRGSVFAAAGSLLSP